MFKILLCLLLAIPSSAVMLGTRGAASARGFGLFHTSGNAPYVDVKSIHFADASSQSISASNTSDQNFSTAMTLSLWVKAPNTATTMGLITKGSYGGTQTLEYLMYRNSAGPTKVEVVVSSTGAFDKQYRSSITVFDNTWHHVVMTFGLSTLKIYVDGNLDASPTKINDGVVATLFGSTVGLRMGSLISSGTPANFLTGNIDEVSIWAVEFNATEVTALYNSGKPADLTLNSQYSNLKAWYKMGDGDTISASGIIDSKNANNMSPTNTPTIQTDAP